MLTIMLVDDEPIILEKLSFIINSSSREITIVASADNGEEALRLARIHQPQVILTDICMPHVNGIDFTHRLRQEFPETIVILISGYNEFNYAQQAIENGVFRYLLKPVSPDELINTLEEARHYFAVRQEELLERERLQTIIKEHLPQLQEKFFFGLLMDEVSPDNLQQQLTFLELAPKGSRFGAILIQLDDFSNIRKSLKESDIQLVKFRLITLARDLFDAEFPFFYAFVHHTYEIICLYGINDEQSGDEVYQTLLKVQSRFNEGQNTTFSAGLGQVYASLSNLHQSYQEAQLALEFKIWAGRSTVIHYSDIERSRSGRLLPLQGRDALTTLLRKGEPEDSRNFILNFFKIGVRELTSKNLLHLSVFDLINQIIYTVVEFSGNPDQIFGDRFDPLKSVDACETIDDLERLVLELSTKACAFISSCKQNFNKGFVEKAKIYLEEHYTDQDISLGSVADCVYVSVSYLSHIFKQSMGCTVTEYLTGLRIRAAQRLLKDSQMKIYEIAEAVGFNDSHYFSIAFKKATGLSPLEFRDKIQISNQI